jgi:alkanesulfonate monooxygenase SsuD/methylene tetrahydromethanopterin reductase-like flavin-dependent oxidoreductase (luciferase family)
MNIDTQMRDVPFHAIAREAQRYERMGFDGVPLALAAAATERLHIGTNISVAFGRSPFTMAQVAWDLQRGSNGRFHLGLGTQVRAHVERRFSMPFEHPATHFKTTHAPITKDHSTASS